MPIYQMVDLATVQVVPPMGRILANHATRHFAGLYGAGIGIANNSCNAALAINVTPGYPRVARLGDGQGMGSGLSVILLRLNVQINILRIAIN